MAESEDIRSLLGEEEDVAQSMQLATMAFHRLLGLLANLSASLQLKVRIWNALVRPVLLYGCGTWGLTAALTEKL